ncbi:MAG: NGG1p interacting factor NIF3 [Candidatus Portnoybacteria bacterium RBG_13_41_18]|uniref:NGG1p interacting factor NIF3 n=1 Tax=Candidatus Portnoybacteria bacterium RBG_13_41_18 TaxID=1801991 RepID=A0A1G2F9W3_9BACT|nr:MAG: NGG1p interacting factor NIF3 [Candidatus Portnoybacteria bacterium RBG_13_41_18]
MTQKQIFELAIQMGTKADLRGEAAVKKYLARQKKKYDELPPKKQADFDKERLTNPYTDSGIWVDDGKPVKKMLTGIDVDTAELMLAKNLGADTYLLHHPVGKGLARIEEVMHMQADVLALYGVPINIAESLLKIRISEVARGVHAINHYRVINSASLLKINLMNLHTPCDNLVADFLKKEIENKKPEYVGEVVDILKNIEEYKISAKQGAPIKMFSGSKENKAGRIALTEITGGTEGAKDIYKAMANAGVGTIVAMHQSEEHRKNAEDAHINVIVASHIASDSIGLNLFLDEIEKKGIEIIPCSGLIRVKRFKK